MQGYLECRLLRSQSRKAKIREKISKKRQTIATNQAFLEEMEDFEHEYYQSDQVDEYGFEDSPQ